jgi:glycosyltransferase involved in cell wall biosynthesis
MTILDFPASSGLNMSLQPPRRLRVAQITLGLEVGGQERLLAEMARHRDASRFDWTVIVLGRRGPLAEAIEAVGVRVLSLDEPAGFRPMLWRRLARLLRQERFDIVHTHDDRPLLYAMPAAWWAGIPRRVHTHHHGRLGQVRWQQRWLVQQAARCAQYFVCVSQDSARYAIEQGVDARHVQTLWNGIDLARFARQGPCDEGPIVTVARLSPEKDIANLLYAVRHVVAAFPEARFEIAGDGPCRADLAQLTKDLQLTEHVLFHGEVRDIPALLARARLFVLPSQTEGISLTLLEAMARGLPVVTTQVGGNPEVVESGTTGLLVPAGNPEALGQAITSALADPERSRQMGYAGRCRVERCFDIREMMAQYEALYEGFQFHSSSSERSGNWITGMLPITQDFFSATELQSRSMR